MASSCDRFFLDADKDGDNRLTISELTEALRRHGYKGSDEQILGFFKSVINPGDDFIKLEDYKSAMQKLPVAFHREAVLRRTFRSFDKDGNGEIDRGELKQVFAKIGKLTDDQTTAIMNLVDVNQSGSMDYEEFITSLDTFKQ